MIQNIIKAMALGGAMLLSAASLSAAIPEHLYMVGEASPSLWHIDIAWEMTNEGDGVFSYHGPCYMQNLRFIDARDWQTGVQYGPELGGWHLKDASTATIITGAGDGNNFWVTYDEMGTYDIKVYFGDNGDSVYITADLVADMPPMVVPMGAVSNQWDTASVPYTYNMYPAEGMENTFVWEGSLAPNPARKHFKFISYPGNYWETWFYIPEECDYNEEAGKAPNVKLVTPGETYPVKRVWGNTENTESDAVNDHFWGFAPELCTPEKTYRMTLNLDDDTIKFEEIEGSGVSEIADSTLKAWFVGDELVVEGANAGIEVYDIAGRKVAQSAGEALTAAGLSNGVYVVKTPGKAIKIAK